MSKALFLTHENPFPPRGSDKLRDFHVLRLLCERIEEVELLCVRQSASSESEDPALYTIPGNLKITVIEPEVSGLFHRFLKRVKSDDDYEEAVESALEERAEPGRVLWVSRLSMANCVPMARSLGYRVILDEHNVERIPKLWAGVKARRHESVSCLKSNAVVAASNLDATRLARLVPGVPVHIIPNSVDHSKFESARTAEGTTLFFSGSLDHPTNIDGLEWFAGEVLPRLRANLGQRLPRVVVAGANPSDAFRTRLEISGIEVLPNPTSMLPHFVEAAVVFVPIRSGGGTPLKILEAMAAGRPVVSTGKATEGLVLAPTYDILIADNADGFASAILRLFDNPLLRKELGTHAAATVLDRYDWRCGRDTLIELLRSVKD